MASTRSFDTAALATSYPFASAGFDHPDGVLYGTTLDGKGTVFWDRYTADNHNSVILARSGAGKSYLAKLEVLRSLYRGVQVFVVDPLMSGSFEFPCSEERSGSGTANASLSVAFVGLHARLFLTS